MMSGVYDDEKVVDDATAERLATAYSAMLTALDAKSIARTNDAVNVSTTELLTQILMELRALRQDLLRQKRVRLEF